MELWQARCVLVLSRDHKRRTADADEADTVAGGRRRQPHRRLPLRSGKFTWWSSFASYLVLPVSQNKFIFYTVYSLCPNSCTKVNLFWDGVPNLILPMSFRFCLLFFQAAAGVMMMKKKVGTLQIPGWGWKIWHFCPEMSTCYEMKLHSSFVMNG